MKAALLRAYWREGRDIGDIATLADIAGEVGLDRAVTLRLLHSDADTDTVRARIAHSRERGVNSVPTFILANQHALQGAQPTESWLKVIDELSDKSKER